MLGIEGFLQSWGAALLCMWSDWLQKPAQCADWREPWAGDAVNRFTYIIVIFCHIWDRRNGGSSSACRNIVLSRSDIIFYPYVQFFRKKQDVLGTHRISRIFEKTATRECHFWLLSKLIGPGNKYTIYFRPRAIQWHQWFSSHIISSWFKLWNTFSPENGFFRLATLAWGGKFLSRWKWVDWFDTKIFLRF